MSTEYNSETEWNDVLFEYCNMNNRTIKNRFVPFGGDCLLIQDESEIICKIQNIIDDIIIPSDIFDVEEYLLKLKIIYTDSLSGYKNTQTVYSDELSERCIIITERLIAWLTEEILEFNPSPRKNKEKVTNYINKLVSESYDKSGTPFINKAIANSIIELLSGNPLTRKINWEDTDWKLYVIHLQFISLKFLHINTDEIIDYILIHFHFPNKNVSKGKLNDSIKRSQNAYKFQDFTTIISKITTN